MSATTKTGIVIDLDQLELLTQEYLRENRDPDDDLYHQILFSHFLQWAVERCNSNDNNILTFRIEKGASK
jgi:hypothetical protein